MFPATDAWVENFLYNNHCNHIFRKGWKGGFFEHENSSLLIKKDDDEMVRGVGNFIGNFLALQ